MDYRYRKGQSCSENLSNTMDSPYKQLFELAAEEEKLQMNTKAWRAEIQIIEQFTDEHLGRMLCELSAATEKANFAQESLDLLEVNVPMWILRGLRDYEQPSIINVGLGPLLGSGGSLPESLSNLDVEKIVEVWGKTPSGSLSMSRGPTYDTLYTKLERALQLFTTQPKPNDALNPHYKGGTFLGISAAQYSQVVSEVKASLAKAHIALGEKFRAVEAHSTAMQSQKHSVVELQSRIHQAESRVAEVVKAQQELKQALSRLHLQDGA